MIINAMTTAIAKPFQSVLTLISQGMTVSDACSRCNVKPYAFYKAKKGSPDLQAEFALAQEIGAEALADTLQNINERVRDPIMARVVSENRRWLLSKRQSTIYGDKLPAQTQHDADLTAILKEAIARIPRPVSDQQTIIEANNVTISDIFGE